MNRGLRPEPFALIAATLAVVMAILYILLIRSQGNEGPLAWVLAILLIGACLAGYGAWAGVPGRRTALFVAGGLLIVLGMLALLSIGLPIILAGALCLISAARTPHARAVRS